MKKHILLSCIISLLTTTILFPAATPETVAAPTLAMPGTAGARTLTRPKRVSISDATTTIAISPATLQAVVRGCASNNQHLRQENIHLKKRIESISDITNEVRKDNLALREGLEQDIPVIRSHNKLTIVDREKNRQFTFRIHPAGTLAVLKRTKAQFLLATIGITTLTTLFAWNKRDDYSTTTIGTLVVGGAIICALLRQMTLTLKQIKKHEPTIYSNFLLNFFWRRLSTKDQLVYNDGNMIDDPEISFEKSKNLTEFDFVPKNFITHEPPRLEPIKTKEAAKPAVGTPTVPAAERALKAPGEVAPAASAGTPAPSTPVELASPAITTPAPSLIPAS